MTNMFSNIAEKFVSNKLIAGLQWDIRIKNEVLSSGVTGFKDNRSKEPLEKEQKNELMKGSFERKCDGAFGRTLIGEK